MPASEADRIHALADFADFLGGLAEEGCEVVVIGSIAVGAYASVVGETLLAVDLDIVADGASLDFLFRWCVAQGAVVRRPPLTPHGPSAFVDWHGLTVNIPQNSVGLPASEVMVQRARGFRLPGRPNLPVLVADPYDLLANKLRANGLEDRLHIDLLHRFIAEEAVEIFSTARDPRDSLAPARRLLRAMGARTLPTSLAARLVPLARTRVDLCFLMQSVNTNELADRVQERAAKWPDAAAEVAEIRRHRRFPRG